MKYILMLLILSCSPPDANDPQEPDWGETKRRNVNDEQYLNLKWKQPKGEDIEGVELSVRCFKNPNVPNNWFERIDCKKNLNYEYPVYKKRCTTYEFALRSYKGNPLNRQFSDYSSIRQYHTAKTDPNFPAPVVTFDFDGYEYESSGSLKLTWDADETATYFKVIVLYIDDSEHITEFPKPDTTDNYIVISREVGFVGHFAAMVSACNSEGCSEWASTLNPEHAVVNGVPKAFRIYWKLAPVLWDM